MRTYGMRFRMSVVFGTLFILTGLFIELFRYYGIPFTDYKGSRAEMENEMFTNFSLTADLHKERILSWIDERKKDMDLMAQSPTVRSRIAAIGRLIQNYKAQGLKGDELWRAVRKDKPSRDFAESFESQRKVYGVFRNLIVVDKDSGVALASSDTDDVGKRAVSEDLLKDIFRVIVCEAIS